MSLQKTIEDTIKLVEATNPVMALHIAIKEIKSMLAEGEEDIDNWIKNLKFLIGNPGIILREIDKRVNQLFILEPEAEQKILDHLAGRLTNENKSGASILSNTQYRV